jgi:hypothetical protein
MQWHGTTARLSRTDGSGERIHQVSLEGYNERLLRWSGFADASLPAELQGLDETSWMKLYGWFPTGPLFIHQLSRLDRFRGIQDEFMRGAGLTLRESRAPLTCSLRVLNPRKFAGYGSMPGVSDK